jgi:hypothetical protein
MKITPAYKDYLIHLKLAIIIPAVIAFGMFYAITLIIVSLLLVLWCTGPLILGLILYFPSLGYSFKYLNSIRGPLCYLLCKLDSTEEWRDNLKWLRRFFQIKAG